MIDMHMFSVVLSLPVASRFTEAADTADFVNKLKQFDELVRNQLCNQLKQKVSPESVFFCPGIEESVVLSPKMSHVSLIVPRNFLKHRNQLKNS